MVFGYPDIFIAADNVVEPAKFGPVGLEALDDTFIDYMKKKGVNFAPASPGDEAAYEAVYSNLANLDMIFNTQLVSGKKQ